VLCFGVSRNIYVDVNRAWRSVECGLFRILYALLAMCSCYFYVCIFVSHWLLFLLNPNWVELNEIEGGYKLTLQIRSCEMGDWSKRLCIALYGKPIGELRSVTCHMELHGVIYHVHRWMHLALTLALQAVTLFIYSRGIEGCVYLGVGYISRWFTSPQTITHLSSNYLMVTQPRMKPATFRSYVRHTIIRPPSKLWNSK